ncbi:MAG: S8 family serine peptidase, partial [Brachybacterium sp.]|uniref:S8 family serine peptidase n=1 Tax=Brachybacterium sp. TaxID=1891286 RepID=UPI0026489762
MRPRPIRRLAALSGALLIGTVGLGLPAATADPLPHTPPAHPAPADPTDPADPADPTDPSKPADPIDPAGPADPTDPSDPADPIDPADPEAPGADSAEPAAVIVLLKDQPTSASLTQESSRLQAQQELIDRWSEEYGLEVDRQFGYLVNGFSAMLPQDQLSALSLEPEVASVRRERVYERTEHTARTLEGVPAAFAAHGVDGEGMVISIVDSGLDPSHPDMRLDDCDAAEIHEINPAPEAGFTCKIPTGYNYADETYEITDAVLEAHGQHVAGIAAANGSEGDEPGDFLETGRIDGVAPNAQLLAMKVFSNSGGGASDSDIVAAIEDSVKLDADVINLSLGSPNGQKNASDATSMAIQSARDAGVISVIAAGNDGQNFSPTGIDDDAFGLLDDGTVGAPGTQGSAFTVASIDNSVLTQLMAYVDDDTEGIPYSPATGSYDDLDHPLVDISLARVQDVEGLQLDGAYALIERGEIAFTEKYVNAIDAGAGGVVVVNSAEGGDTPFAMAGVEEFTIPGITLSRTVGTTVQDRVAAGPTTIRITDEVDVRPSPTALEPSAFTSWGSTPSLDFEPEIAGIGGTVYSTYNDGTYGLGSGTSMASPNVAGLAALILEHLAETRPDVTGAERVDLAKVLLMNTAMVPTDDDGVPYSPRQIGAGLAQVDQALETEVIATVDGGGAAALREIDGSRAFTVTLTNSGERAAAFTVPAIEVLAETNEAGAATDVRGSDGSAEPSQDEITVPAGGTASLEVTLTPESGDPHFVEGWVRLSSETAEQPSLAVPFLGVAGEWNAEPIIRPAGDELIEGAGVRTELITSWGGQTLPLTSELGQFWLSPNGDGDMDTIAANLVVMRNAADIRYEVLTSSGENVSTLGQEQGLSRTLLGDYGAVADPRSLQWTGASFDGTLYDPQAMDDATLPDGQYTYRISTRLGEDQPWQRTDLDFGIDATAPSIEFGAHEQNLLTFTVAEDGSGLLSPPTATAADGTELPVTRSADGSYALEVAASEVPFITVSALDAGFNLGVGTKVFAADTLMVPDADQLAAGALGPQSLLVSAGKLLLSGYVSSDVAAVRAGEQRVPTPEGRFRLPLALVEGPQQFHVEALDADGQVVDETTVPVTYDSHPPELTITDMPTDADGSAVLAADGSLTIAGTVTDEREGADLSVSVGSTETEVADDGTFEITVTPGEDATAIGLVASDGVNTVSTPVPLAGRGQAASGSPPEFTNADCVLDSAACFVPGTTEDVSEDTSVFTLRGTYPAGGTIALTPGSRVGEDGRYVDGEPISAEIAEDGSFTADLPVTTGENHLRMVVSDAEGQVRYDRGVRFYVDVTAPTLSIDEPSLLGGTLYANTEQVTVAGTAEDDGWGYTLALNDSVVLERFDIAGPGEESNRRGFSTEVDVADGDTLLVQFADSNGNLLLGLVPVVLDRSGPTVSIDDLADGERISGGRDLRVAAEDENLATLQVSLDGEVIHEDATALTTQEHSLEDALIDVQDLQTVTSEAMPASGTLTTAAQTRLEATVATADLTSGEHLLAVASTDLAGNITTETRAFRIEAELGISGPDAVERTVHREELGDQAGLTALVLDEHAATLDGEEAAAEEADAELSLAPNTVLTEGEQVVTVLAADGAGRTAQRELTVTLALERVTLRDGEVTATSTFRSDDVLTASIDRADGVRVLTIGNREEFGALPAEVTVPGSDGDVVVRLLADGTAVPMPVTWADGVLTFDGPSRGVYRIIPAPPVPGPGDEGAGPGDAGDGPGAQLPPGDGGGGNG